MLRKYRASCSIFGEIFCTVHFFFFSFYVEEKKRKDVRSLAKTRHLLKSYKKFPDFPGIFIKNNKIREFLM